MECKQSQEYMSAYLDGELGPSESAQLSAHLEECRQCRSMQDELRALRALVAGGATRYAAPEHLKHRIRAAIKTEQQREAATRAPVRAGARERAGGFTRWPWAWINLGLTGLSTAAFAVTLTLYLQQPSGEDQLEQELVASHFRALMPDHLSDVVSTDQHTVKPWFAGKLDYSPPVYDLAQQGFPLIGGRLDYVNHRPVAAMAYQHRKHILNLYVWPVGGKSAQATTTSTPRATSHQGFQMVRWRQGDMEFSAISDVNGQDLAEFARLLRDHGAATTSAP